MEAYLVHLHVEENGVGEGEAGEDDEEDDDESGDWLGRMFEGAE
jgi:hypothetical protein